MGCGQHPAFPAPFTSRVLHFHNPGADRAAGTRVRVAHGHSGTRLLARARNPFTHTVRGPMDSGFALRAPRNDEREVVWSRSGDMTGLRKCALTVTRSISVCGESRYFLSRMRRLFVS